MDHVANFFRALGEAAVFLAKLAFICAVIFTVAVLIAVGAPVIILGLAVWIIVLTIVMAFTRFTN